MVKTTISVRAMARDKARDRRRGNDTTPPEDYDADRPKTRADCASVPRPCPWVSCRHNLRLDVGKNGSLIFNHGLLESCSLDVAAEGPHKLDVIGLIYNCTRESIRQQETEALEKLQPIYERTDCLPGTIDGQEHNDYAGRPVTETLAKAGEASR